MKARPKGGLKKRTGQEGADKNIDEVLQSTEEEGREHFADYVDASPNARTKLSAAFMIAGLHARRHNPPFSSCPRAVALIN